MKWPLAVALGAALDLRARSFAVPAALAGTLAALAAAGLSTLLKGLVERARPAVSDPSLSTLVATPDSASLPSGHAATAFAAAVVVGSAHPRLRVPLLVLAGAVALSRVYLGVHYWLDVLAGAALGTAVGLGALACRRRLAARVAWGPGQVGKVHPKA